MCQAVANVAIVVFFVACPALQERLEVCFRTLWTNIPFEGLEVFEAHVAVLGLSHDGLSIHASFAQRTIRKAADCVSKQRTADWLLARRPCRQQGLRLRFVLKVGLGFAEVSRL